MVNLKKRHIAVAFLLFLLSFCCVYVPYKIPGMWHFVFHYEPDTASGLARAVMPWALRHIDYPDDFRHIQWQLNKHALIVGACLNAFVALGLTLPMTLKAIRHGGVYMAYAGILIAGHACFALLVPELIINTVTGPSKRLGPDDHWF